MGVTTPLGADKLLLAGFSGTESLASLFSFRLDCLALNETAVPFDALLGRSITVWIRMAGNKKRFFNGICNRIAQGSSDRQFTAYHLDVVPKIWMLSRKTQSRIFQHLTVPDILKKVLAGFDAEYSTQGTFQPRDYCVQYRESDLHFAQRLMEEEGIYYFFKHSDGAHKMVLSNVPAGHPEVEHAATIPFENIGGGVREDERITHWIKRQELRSGKVTLWDHCFELPHKHLEAEKPIAESVAVGGVTLKMKTGGNDAMELYDYPGAYAQRFDGITKGGGEQPAELQKIFSDNKRTVALRMDEEAAQGIAIEGASNCRQLCAGQKFKVQTVAADQLAKHQKADGSYVLTTVSHSASNNSYRSGDSGEMQYSNAFTCIPAALPYAPPRTAQKPTVQGTQTAVVVGPSGEEIFTDKYSRIKVQFHWDRAGKNDADSSCWVRVGTPWAGKNWGMIHIPRIGQEVVVDFLEGDPDQPIVVGSVYNADMMPPYKLPDNRTQCGIKSRSSLKGTPDNFNELRFEDKKDSEQIYFHAEKNFDRVVENNDTLKVGFEKKDKGDQTIEIFNNQSEKIGAGKGDCADGSQTLDVWNTQTITIGSGKGQCKDGSRIETIWKNRTTVIETGNDTLTVKKGNRTSTISTGDEKHEVTKGNRDVIVGTGNDTHKIDKGNRAVVIAMGNDSLDIKMGNQTTKLALGKSATEAMQSIELKVGQSSIKLEQSGITIKGMMVKVEGTIQTDIKGAMTNVTGSGICQVKGGLVMIG